MLFAEIKSGNLNLTTRIFHINVILIIIDNSFLPPRINNDWSDIVFVWFRLKKQDSSRGEKRAKIGQEVVGKRKEKREAEASSNDDADEVVNDDRAKTDESKLKLNLLDSDDDEIDERDDYGSAPDASGDEGDAADSDSGILDDSDDNDEVSAEIKAKRIERKGKKKKRDFLDFRVSFESWL